MEKIKPCPFCGEEATALVSKSYSEVGFSFTIRCKKCETVEMALEKRVISCSFDEITDAINAVISKWNRRAERSEECGT